MSALQIFARLIACNLMKLFYAEKAFMWGRNFVVGVTFSSAIQHPSMLINTFKISINDGSWWRDDRGRSAAVGLNQEIVEQSPFTIAA
jgi:hypothetical protein